VAVEVGHGDEGGKRVHVEAGEAAAADGGLDDVEVQAGSRAEELPAAALDEAAGDDGPSEEERGRSLQGAPA
jgi:hypothetical protein